MKLRRPPAGEAVPSGGGLPLWAYPVGGIVPSIVPGGATPVEEPLEHVPGSSAGYTKAQIADLFTAPDWFPAAHPAMRQRSRRDASQSSSRARTVTCRTGWDVQRTRVSLGCRLHTLKSKSLTSRTIFATARTRACRLRI